MSFYRSDDMEFFRIIMPRQSAWETINLLGKEQLVHIVPNKDNQMVRPFIQQVKRCEEALAKIKTIERTVQEKKIGVHRDFISEEDYESLRNMWEVHEKTGGNQESRFIETEEEINRIWTYQQQLQARKSDIKEKLLILRQNIAIIRAGQKQYGDAFFSLKAFNPEKEDNPAMASAGLEMKAIVTDGKGRQSVKRTLNRITRGNSFINEVSFDDIFGSTLSGEESKSVIFVIYPAKKDSLMDKKVIKVIENYCSHWDSYVLPQDEGGAFHSKMAKIEQNYEQTEKMYSFTEEEENKFFDGLQDKVEAKNITLIEYYKYYLLKQKQIYSQLNEMTTHSNFVDGEVYIRSQNVEEVMEILHKVGSDTQTPMGRLAKETTDKLPTFFSVNDFKMPAQQITNTYGIPRYKQANPSFFALITFPFLFGVMFGDIAHGFILFCFGLFLLNQSPNSSNSVIRALFSYRYLVTLMGFFATYCGFVYNDFLSLPLNLFHSCYDRAGATQQQPIHRLNTDCVYPFGLDPIWGVASNNLNFINSLKMKIAVIIAVVHMTVGVFVKASNALFFKRWLDFFFEFVPQVIFMVALFGYMDFLIIYKWLTPWKLYEPNAPSIITTMINLPLKVGKTDQCCGGQPLWGEYENTTQDSIQLVLLALGLICVPLMLLPKPIIQIVTGSHHDKHEVIPSDQSREARNEKFIDDSEFVVPDKIDKRDEKQNHQTKSLRQVKKQNEHDAGEIFVHQLIETIEYVLGCISNTASYLRLWALSLAHSQLSQVFFQKTIESGLNKGVQGLPILILAFPILAGATFGVLLCMDSMECFLHTLRLHWVEFQNKFYKGDGILFSPLSFKGLIKEQVAKS